MRRPGGYFICVDPDPPRGTPAVVERDTFTCAHHGGIVRVPPMCDAADAGGLCRNCGGLICRRCAARGECVPLERALAAAERGDDLARALRG